MEQYNAGGYEYVSFMASKAIKSKPYGSGDGKTTQIDGGYSLFNRYALFAYRGDESFKSGSSELSLFNSDKNVTDSINNDNGNSFDDMQKSAIGAALSVQSPDNKRPLNDNPKAANIIKYFKEKPSNACEYDWSDFLWCKNYGLISNNYMITLRRFPYAVEDNIFNDKIVPSPDIARAITFWGQGTDNSINSVLGFSTGFNWKELTSEIQSIHSQKFGNPITTGTGSIIGASLGSIFGGMTGGIIGGAVGGATAAGVSTLNTANTPNYQDKNTAFIKTGQNFNDPIEMDGFYHNKILGPVNVINKMYIRDTGLKYNQEINLKFEYSLKSFPGISPKKALIDILVNLLTLGYNNAPFWGGAIRYQNDNRTSHILGDQDKLLKGDYLGYLSSVSTDFTNQFKNVFGGKDGSFDVNTIVSGLVEMGKAGLSGALKNFLPNTGAVPNFQVVNALLSGEASGEWHITVGNPLNPIAVMGNLILDDMNITFDETLGSEDFPIGIRAEFKLKPARPRDKTDIENMFNLGQGRMYYVPESKDDVLNVAGFETYHVGVVNGSKKPGDTQYETSYSNLQMKDKINGNKPSNSVNRFQGYSDDSIMNSYNFHSVTEHTQNKAK